jgi:hypothetical protein
MGISACLLPYEELHITTAVWSDNFRRNNCPFYLEYYLDGNSSKLHILLKQLDYWSTPTNPHILPHGTSSIGSV